MRNMAREGHSNGKARLEDMDTDGVEAEVLYSEVSAFRYLGEMREGADESVRAFVGQMGVPGPRDGKANQPASPLPTIDRKMAAVK